MNDEVVQQSTPDLIPTFMDIATPLADLTRGVFDFAHRHFAMTDGEPVSGSRAMIEADGTSSQFSEARRNGLERARQTAISIYLRSAEYLVSAFARLLVPDMEIFGFQIIGRSVVELSAKAWWLIDMQASIETRLGRLFLDELNSLSERAKVGRLLQGSPEVVDQERAKIIDRAAMCGIAPLMDKNNREIIAFGDAREVSSTTMVGSFLTAIGNTQGELFYRTFSAIVHGTSYGLLDFFQLEDIPNSEFKVLVPFLPVETIVQAAILVSQSYLGVVQADTQYIGGDYVSVANARRDVFRQMTALIPSA